MKFAVVAGCALVLISCILRENTGDLPEIGPRSETSGIPRIIRKKQAHFKSGTKILGCELQTDEYVLITSPSVLFGQQVIGGPIMVNDYVVGEVLSIVAVAERAKNEHKKVAFSGFILVNKHTSIPYRYEGKKVMLILDALFDGHIFSVYQGITTHKISEDFFANDFHKYLCISIGVIIALMFVLFWIDCVLNHSPFC